MKPEREVVSLELAQKLRDLGVKQESLFEYRLFDFGGEMVWSKPLFVGEVPKKLGSADVGFGVCSAFTVAELGEMLPAKVNGGYLRIGKRDKDDFAVWYEGDEIEDIEDGYLETVDAVGGCGEADARAKMLIYLLENGLVKV
jgi:hypothetical protein